jgi:tetratricopeptide (TPR) repeat protein
MLFSLLCATVLPAPAQTAKHTVPARPHTAGTASHSQLAALLAEFQKTPEDATLRSQIVALAKTMNPAPAIPPLARANFAQATAVMNAAAAADDYKAAAKSFEDAAVQAPWYAEADYNAAYASSKADDFDGVRRNLELYLSAVRPGVDTGNAEQLRRNVDRRQAEQQFQQALQQFKANPSDVARLEIIKVALAMKPPPEVPEEARGHYVMATVFVNAAADIASYEHAIAEYKAALLIAPWWTDAYRKLATAQTAAGRYDDAVANLNIYLLTKPDDLRSAQDEIYRLTALAQKAADEKAKKQAEEQQRKLQQVQQQKERSAVDARNYTAEGKWYVASTPNEYFVGGEANPECDYSVKQNAGKWSITNTCSGAARIIDNIDAQPKRLNFRITRHETGYPISEVIVTLVLSADGQTFEGRGTAYDKDFFPLGDHPVRWMRRGE